ncbi:hypothetical protein SO802_015340 [Lithocarpus litseifolius]|uniref:Thioredoxin domain-containing protein n=1 Tax=Lithocarpus litseifolius TaxID=425828 RepID=A0AAW2CU22_9ROSI
MIKQQYQTNLVVVDFDEPLPTVICAIELFWIADDLVHETPVSSNGRAEDVVQETPASSNVRKTRGTTLMTRIWSLPANLKIECELNVRGQPIGESGQTFTRCLGTFCLSHALCPLVPVAWTRVPQKNKLDCWIEIEKRWIIDPEIIQPANQMSWALHLLGELRRNRRTKLKKKCYLPNALKEEVIGKIPRWADEQDYAALVDYWFLPSTKTLIDKNKSSRGFQKDIARSGPISFAQTADKMAKESGQAVERATLFAKVYSTKDGAPVSTAVKEKIDKMTAILNNGCTLHGERRDGILWAKDDAFAQVIGAKRSGRVRGVGFGPTPSGRSGSNLPCYTSTPLSSTETANRMTSLENSHQSLRDELAQSEQRHKEEVAEIHAKHKEEIAEALAEAKRQSDAQHKEQLDEAKRQFDAQHRVQMEDMMSSLKAALDHLSPGLNLSGSLRALICPHWDIQVFSRYSMTKYFSSRRCSNEDIQVFALFGFTPVPSFLHDRSKVRLCLIRAKIPSTIKTLDTFRAERIRVAEVNQGELSDEDDDLCPAECVREFKTDEELSRVLEKAKETDSLVVVDFYRPSCGSCKYIEQGFGKLCRGSGDQDAPVIFLKHNVIDEYDEQSEVADRLRIKESPNKLGDKVLSSLLKKMKLLSMLGFVSFHFIQGGVGGT